MSKIRPDIDTDTCEVYEPVADQWQLIASLNTPQAGGSMVCLGGTLHVVVESLTVF